jgi:hypothetical protein
MGANTGLELPQIYTYTRASHGGYTNIIRVASPAGGPLVRRMAKPEFLLMLPLGGPPKGEFRGARRGGWRYTVFRVVVFANTSSRDTPNQTWYENPIEVGVRVADVGVVPFPISL